MISDMFTVVGEWYSLLKTHKNQVGHPFCQTICVANWQFLSHTECFVLKNYIFREVFISFYTPWLLPALRLNHS